MNARERNMAIVTGVVVGGALLFTQVLEPGYKRWTDLAAREHGVEQALVRDKALVEELPALKTGRQELDAGLRPPKGTGLIPWFISHVNELADESGFTPGSLRFVSARPLDEQLGRGRRGAAPKQSPFAELRFELRAKAPLKRIQGFLVRLAASDRHVRVVSLGLTPPKRGSDMDANMSLVALAPIDLVGEEDG